MYDNYIIDSIQGKYIHYGECRLTRVFVATFNASNHFKKVLLDFIGESKLRIEGYKCVAETQDDKKTGINDIKVYYSSATNSNSLGKKIFVIENKVEDVLTEKQLARYNNNKRDKVYAFVKYYFLFNSIYNVNRWANFYEHLESSLKNKIVSEVDKFIIYNF